MKKIHYYSKLFTSLLISASGRAPEKTLSWSDFSKPLARLLLFCSTFAGLESSVKMK